MKELDLTGKIFNKLTAIKRAGTHVSSGGFSSVKWLFMCVCGNERIARSNDVIMGKVRGCKNCAKLNKQENARTNGKLGGLKRTFNFENATFRARAAQFKSNARNRDIEWKLSLEETCELIKKDCHYCGHPPKSTFDYVKSRSAKDRKRLIEKNVLEIVIKFNGLDRVDSDLGYTKENSVPCCVDCNFAKNDKTVQEFMAWLRRISEFQEKKQSLR